jgi:RNA-directed DNA polymerase
VYCKDGKLRLDHEHTSVTFLGFTFGARRARGRGRNFTSFLPAISNDASHKASAQVRS